MPEAQHSFYFESFIDSTSVFNENIEETALDLPFPFLPLFWWEDRRQILQSDQPVAKLGGLHFALVLDLISHHITSSDIRYPRAVRLGHADRPAYLPGYPGGGVPPFWGDIGYFKLFI